MKKIAIVVILILSVIIIIWSAYGKNIYRTLLNNTGIVTSINKGGEEGKYDIYVKGNGENEADSYVLSISSIKDVKLQNNQGRKINISELKIGDTIYFEYKEQEDKGEKKINTKIGNEHLLVSGKIEIKNPILHGIRLIKIINSN